VTPPETPPDTKPRSPVLERVEELLRADTPDAVAEAVAIGRDTDALTTADLGRLAGRFLVTGHLALARALVEEADRRGLDELNPGQRRRLDHLRPWTHPSPRPAPPPGAVHVGVFYYQQPDRPRGSNNIGDYVQTLSMLGNLARFESAEFSGVDGLGELATELQGRVRPELRIEGEPRQVHLVPVSRDFSAGEQVEDGTWLLAFGWHLHASYELRFGLPYHPSLRPLFVSFHLHSVDALDDETVAYLRKHGPVGCRDWTTVDLLLSAGIDAFFTGCVTSTVDAVFPLLRDVDRSQANTIGVIDADVPGDLAHQPVERLTNADPGHRDLDLVTGTRAAIKLLGDYQRRFARIITSRLHAYLPATTLGLDVDFRPKLAGDARFTGLAGLSPDSADLETMRTGLRDLIAASLAVIFSGKPADEVYAAWRARTAPLVEEARARHDAAPPAYPSVDLSHVERRLREQPPVPVGGRSARTLVWAPEDTPSAADLLGLPELLPDADRIVVLDEDGGAVDVERLAVLDLGGHRVAAQVSSELAAHVWRRAANRLPAGDAAELRRLTSARLPFSTRAVARAPVVLDLRAMRTDLDDLHQVLSLATYFDLDALEALLAYAGEHVTPLDQTT
jgi:hypothetical protein